MFEIIEFNAFSKHVVASAATIEAAVALVPGGVAFIEEDEDHPGCFDVLTRNGKVYAIETAA